MVQVSQEQKRVIKKFAAVGYEYDTLTERNVWAIHYLLTHTNPGVADGERAPSPVALGRTYGEYWRGRNGGIGDGLKGMRDMWRNARRIVSSDAERARLDDSMRATVIDSIKGNDIMFRAHVERDYPTALIADMDIYDGWLYMDDERLAEWWSDDADRRIRDYAGRVSSVFLDAIRRCPDDDELACDGVVMLAALMYALWHVMARIHANEQSIEEFENRDYQWDTYDEQWHRWTKLRAACKETSVSKALAFLVPAYTHGVAPDYNVFR